MSNELKAIEDIEGEFQQLEFKEAAWLRKQGWQYKTSRYDCCWHWTKVINGAVYLVNKSTALTMAKRKLEFEADD